VAEAAFWGFIAASSLVVAAEVAFRFKLSSMVIGLVMAFGVGALISAVSFELVAESLESAEIWQVTLALACGSIVFFIGDRMIANIGGEGRKNTDDEDDEDGGSGLGIVLGTVLDGVPESAVLGMSLVGGAGVSVSLMVSIWISNFPESLASSVNLEKDGMPRSKIRLMWWAIVAVSVSASAIGFYIVDQSSTRTGAFISAFAAGSLLTMIADEMAPEAYERSSIYSGLATVGGFSLAVFLTTLD
jgi:ZIP family zinc transporter